MAAKASTDDLYRVLSTAVDTAFYRGVYDDLARAAVDPVAHYGQVGWQERRDPAPWFSTEAYLENNPDVADSGLNPLYHYLVKGRAEGREIGASTLADGYLFKPRMSAPPTWAFEQGKPPAPVALVAPPRPDVALTTAQYALVAAAFDAGFYLGAHPDVAAAGQDPLEHFLMAGWRERRDPAPGFSIVDYLELNPEVAAAGINPFAHYLETGRAEGRIPKRSLGFRYEIIAGLVPMETRLAQAAQRAAAIPPADPGLLAAALAKSRTGLKDLHVTFSHDDYAANVGGVQLCIQREAARIGALGRDHLHVFPSSTWPMVREQSPATLGVLWNGVFVGHFEPSRVTDTLATAIRGASPGARSFAIHNLLGHAVQDVLDLLAAARLTAGFFWIHDFGSLCDGYHLMRNDVADCGAPPPDSPACSVCVYGPQRRPQIAAHERLFDSLKLTAVAPSQAAMDTWRAGWRFRTAGEIVLPHATLSPRTGQTAASPEGPFRFAFLGMPAAHKGWPIFRDLALRFAADPRYQFLHLAQAEIRGLPITHHPVTVTHDQPLAMLDAVEALKIDAAMIWSLCRETFSFATYEAVAGGACVITGPDSGNVARFVQTQGHGEVIADETALTALFETGAILDFARARRTPELYDLSFSGLSVDLLETAR